MSHQTLWAENGNGRLRSPLNGMEQIDGECQKPSSATAQPLLQEERSEWRWLSSTTQYIKRYKTQDREHRKTSTQKKKREASWEKPGWL
ncbi:hypothetical protein AVEN_86226-1 [Araneus ventricosus]|uniref:Uncharacterized protein n=1 Tax=Araneus ventricosus TaxID=182803 RepID=A0A4Y2SXJ2_ARAVE|nr:hypothetical protein AVEN_86226-1 [Araneus ventricosus]